MIFPRGTGGVMLAILVMVRSINLVGSGARFRRRTGAAFGSCRCNRFIVAIRGIIGSPPCSPTSIRPSIAVSRKRRSIGDTSVSSTPVERLALRLLFGPSTPHPLGLQLRTFLALGLDLINQGLRFR